MSEWQPHQVFAAVKEMVADNPDNISIIVEAVTAGAKENTERMNNMRVWADQALMAATMLLTAKVQTPTLKRHLEFCLSRYYEANGGCKAANDWLAAHPLPTPTDGAKAMTDTLEDIAAIRARGET